MTETLPTLSACEWLLSPVNFHVILQVFVDFKTLFTLLAFKRLFFGMKYCVPVKVFNVPELPSTLTTFKQVLS